MAWAGGPLHRVQYGIHVGMEVQGADMRYHGDRDRQPPELRYAQSRRSKA